MSDVIESTDASPLTKDGWAKAMDSLTDEQGYFHSLGPDHFALFIDESPTLLVTFESLQDVLGREGQMPQGYDLAKAHGWSMLTIFADGPTWFRDSAVFSFFDRQVDDAFFEDFDSVLFYGARMGGYAACSFAVASPGAQVLALNPRATLDPDRSVWDERDRHQRRLDFNSRFGYAPDMLDGAKQAIVVHDMRIPAEAMHSTLFRAPHVLRLSAPLMGENLQVAFSEMQILSPMLADAMAGKLTGLRFAQLLRKRRDYGPYLINLLDAAARSGRMNLQIMVCESVVTRLKSNRFARRLTKLREAQAAQAK